MEKEFDPECPKCNGDGEYHYGGSFGGEVHYAECDCWLKSYLEKQKSGKNESNIFDN